MVDRDAHGRFARTEVDARRRPVDRLRLSERALQHEIDLVAQRLESALQRHVATRLVDLPPAEALPADPGEPGGVPLVRAHVDRDGLVRVEVYGWPLLARATDRADLAALLQESAADAVAGALGTDPDDLLG